jgi:hypothetical protein
MKEAIPTALEIFSFGEKPEDIFYLLFDKRKFEGEVEIDKLKLADPRNFDAILNDMGCVMMLTGDEIQELQLRGEVDATDLHTSIMRLAVKEGIIR